MFTDERIEILAYNMETILAEKYETIISRSIENTRMRDFYDVYILTRTQSYDKTVFRVALERTAENRHSLEYIANADNVIAEIEINADIQRLWQNYQQKYDYAKDVNWDSVIDAVKKLGAI
jgi:predicted nucleotidyltransferase component of viral defense system